MTVPQRHINARHLADCTNSGITPETAALEGLWSMPAALSVAVLGRPQGPGLVFPFGNGFNRVRLDHNGEYRQRARTVNRIWLSKLLPNGILQDPSMHVYATEGEKKGTKMCQEGLWAIAFTGIYGWSVDHKPIPDFEAIAWDGRHVTIVFDSDPGAQSKGNVEKARIELAAWLRVRAAIVDAVILPDDGTEKVGADDFLVRYGRDEFLKLPRVYIPTDLPILNYKKGRPHETYVSDQIERFIWEKLGAKFTPEFGTPIRTILNRGQPADHATMRVKFRGEPRVQVGKATYAWPYASVYCNLLRLAMQRRGKYTMVITAGSAKWFPIWQGLMELDAGALVLTDEYKPVLPECAIQEARDVMEAYLKTAFIREAKFPGSPSVFRLDVLSIVVGRPAAYIRRGWEWLESYGYVDLDPGKTKSGSDVYAFRPGCSPIEDPAAYERWLRDLATQDLPVARRRHGN